MESQDNNRPKPNKDLMIASKIIERASSDSPMKKNLNQKESRLSNDIDKKEHVFIPTSSVTPYILLIALSVHGLFEGMALGVMNTFKDCSLLFLAIILHKWAASFALGVRFYKSGTETNKIIKMIILFAAFGPIGIIIGMFFVEAGHLIEGILLGISGGTFIYVSTSEIIVEEFSVTKDRRSKFYCYLFGGILTAILTLIE